MLSSAALTVIARLEQAGFDAFAVGGCVRDMLRGVEADDVDITTNATPETIMAVFEGERIIPTGLAHGTVTVLLEGQAFEVTTYRRDGTYSDNRHPDHVTFTTDLTEDLARRDFTVNAMAFHPSKGLIDPFGGQRDLQNGVLRCVGDPYTRFTEDALRILRLLRFMSVLKMHADDTTADAAHALYYRLAAVAAERKRVEWTKMLAGDCFEAVALAFPDVMCEVVPALSPLVDFDQQTPYHDYDAYTHTVKAVAACPKDTVVRLAALFHDLGKPMTFFTDEDGNGHFYGHADHSEALARDTMTTLRFDNATIHAVLPLIKYHHAQITPDRKSVRRWLSRLGEEGLRRLLAVKTADALACKGNTVPPDFCDILTVLDTIIREADCVSLKTLAINGHDLQALGMPAGPSIGAMLNALLEAVMADAVCNERDALVAYAQARWHNE